MRADEGPGASRSVEVDHARAADRDAHGRPTTTRSSRAQREPRQLVWIRADGTLPDSPLLHQCVVAYASDLMLLDTATLPHAIAWNDPSYVMASLDHAMWFHRPFRADEWLLYAQESPAAHGRARLHDGPLLHARRDDSS